MKKAPLRIYDMSVRMKWNIEKATEYERNITNVIRFAEMRGLPLDIEYTDDDLNVVGTLKIEGDEEKSLEYESRIEKLIKGEHLNEE